MNEKKSYKKCFVPNCASSTTITPNKIFITVPAVMKRRKDWFKAVGRDLPHSPSSNFFCCEDHFNLQEDVENYYYYTIMGGRIKLKSIVLPRITHCANNKRVNREENLYEVEEVVDIDISKFLNVEIAEVRSRSENQSDTECMNSKNEIENNYVPPLKKIKSL